MTEQRTLTRDTRLAAALGSLGGGIPIEIHKTRDAKSGKLLYIYHLHIRSLCGQHDARRLKAGVLSGSLEALDPSHELLTALRAMMHRERLLDFENKGDFMRLERVPATQLWQYVPGDTGLPGRSGVKELIETQDRKMVCALGLVGVPLMAVDGARGDFRYFLPRMGLPRVDGKPPADALRLMQGWRHCRDAMSPDCPFTQGMWGLVNRERLVNALNAEIENILLRKYRSQKSALVRADAVDAAFDRVKEHFDAG
jgi:hypothetical protein